MLFDGVIALILGILFQEKSVWSSEISFPLIYTVLFPSLIAYLFWDLGISKGNAKLIQFFSLFTVVLSTLFSSVILKIPLRIDVILCSFLLFLGALITQKSIYHNQSKDLLSDQ
jgi:drug/metabolite transporter (DMT)-like permease